MKVGAKTAVTAIFAAFAIATAGGCGESDDFAMDFAIAREGSVIAIPTPLTITGDGIHVVGVDILPGRYTVSFPVVSDAGGVLSKCEWVRLSGPENTAPNRIANGSYETPWQIIVVEDDDVALYTSGCGTLAQI